MAVHVAMCHCVDAQQSRSTAQHGSAWEARHGTAWHSMHSMTQHGTACHSMTNPGMASRRQHSAIKFKLVLNTAPGDD